MKLSKLPHARLDGGRWSSDESYHRIRLETTFAAVRVSYLEGQVARVVSRLAAGASVLSCERDS